MHDESTFSRASDPSSGSAPTEPHASSVQNATNTAIPSAQSRWGSFTLQERVGAGGFGEVYRAWDASLQREVALKLLLPSAVTGEAEYETMLREARALASMRHPNVVSVYGIDRHDGRVGFWTDFVRGKTLAVLVREHGIFSSREAALIGLDIARALAAVHRAGMLHRDIKAENVMREEGGRILLMDFGLSVLDTRTASLAGTPSYMAPELFEGGSATVSSDIYAVGILLYFLVAGLFPVKTAGLKPEEMRLAWLGRIPLTDVRPDVPDALLRTINTAIELDPAKRFASAGQLAEALSESLGTQSLPVLAAVPVKKRPPIAFLAAAVVVLAIAAWAVWSGGIHHALHPGSSSNPTSGTAYDQYLKAQDLLSRSYKNTNVAEAIKGFQQVLQADPSFSLAEASLGRAYFIQYRHSHDSKLLDMAREATSRALTLDANLAPPYVTLARIAAMEGHNALAMQQAQKALSIDPRSSDAYGALAEVYEAEGKPKDAMEAFQKAADLAPDDWRWPVNLGINEFGSGHLQEAVIHWQRGVELAPDNAVAYYDLGIANMQLDEMDKARQSFETSLHIEQDAQTYAALGSVFLLEGKYSDAATMYLKSIQLNSGDYVAWGNLAVAYKWSGKQQEKATEAFQAAIKLGEAVHAKNRDDPMLLVALADYYASIGDSGHSVILIRQALALAPDNPSVEYEAGQAYETLKQREKAIPLIARALNQGYRSNEFRHNPELNELRADPKFAGALRTEKGRKH